MAQLKTQSQFFLHIYKQETKCGAVRIRELLEELKREAEDLEDSNQLVSFKKSQNHLRKRKKRKSASFVNNKESHTIRIQVLPIHHRSAAKSSTTKDKTPMCDKQASHQKCVISLETRGRLTYFEQQSSAQKLLIATFVMVEMMILCQFNYFYCVLSNS